MKCKYCGRELEDDAKFCDNCGEKVQEKDLDDFKMRNLPVESDTRAEAEDITEEKKRSSGLIGFSVFLIVISLICLVATFSYINDYHRLADEYETALIKEDEIDAQTVVVNDAYNAYRDVISNIRKKLYQNNPLDLDVDTVGDDIESYPEKTEALIDAVKEMEELTGEDYSSYYEDVDIDRNYAFFRELKADAEEYINDLKTNSSGYEFRKFDYSEELSDSNIFYDYNSDFEGVNKEDYSYDQRLTIDNNSDEMNELTTSIWVSAMISGVTLLAAVLILILVSGRKKKKAS